MKVRLSLASVVLLSACELQPAPNDAGRDAPLTLVDAFTITSRDVGTPDAPSTSGTSISMTYGTQTGTFDRALMGYRRTGGVVTGLYFELSRGADAACPSGASPTPQQIITIDGFAPAMPAAQTMGIMARFFDFEGTFREEIAPDAPTMSRVQVTALDTTAGTVEGNVMFTFGRGTASGNFRATHCDSLDE